MDNDKLLQSISEMMDTKLDERLQSFSDRMDTKLDERLQSFSDRMDNKLDERLQSFSDRMDTKLAENLQPINNRLDKIESRLDVIEVIQKRTTKKLEDLQLDVKIAEREIRRDIHDLNDEMETVIEVLKMNEMLPQ